jgi:adenine/guanine phosphoribosyltransferase-like PRPP-binding protein
VLLVDDIMTTGATARECSRVLSRAGAAKVWVATLARAQAEGEASRQQNVAMWDANPMSELDTGHRVLAKPGAATGFV